MRKSETPQPYSQFPEISQEIKSSLKSSKDIKSNKKLEASNISVTI